jgi:hypothetical protein
LSEFIVSVIKGEADLTTKKVVKTTTVDDEVVLDTQPEDTPVVHEEL